nr:orofacial cleft 1 candidate gene 1 protein [Marmota flaviventris]
MRLPLDTRLFPLKGPRFKSAHCQGQGAKNMDREKFQQKALKQTKQKKSKSAEFLMVKEDRAATEGIGNPAFNMSSPDLSAHQSSKEKVIRHDMLDRTLAAHQQKSRLPAPAQPKGNEYGRNYFDPLMDEEINPRQCGMEVSREGDERTLYNRLMELFDDSGQREFQDESNHEDTWDSEAPTGSRKSHGLHKEADETTPAYVKEFERRAREDIVLLGSSSSEQEWKFDGEGLHQHIPVSCLKTDKTFRNPRAPPITADLPIGKRDNVAKLGSLTEVTNDSQGAAGSCWQVQQTQAPQPLQIQIKCIRGLKDKAPQGSYLLKVSLLGRPGGCALQWCPTEELKTRTHAVRHNGNFYDVSLYFHESLHVVLPQRKDVKPGIAFLFELFLLRGKHACLGQAVGWAIFPLCDNNLDVVEGKFKCPLLRGHYDRKSRSFRKIEDLICLDLDHWLCNLYFQVVKLPLLLDHQKNHESNTQLGTEFPMHLLVKGDKGKLGVHDTSGPWEKKSEKNICASMDNGTQSTLHSSQGCFANKIPRPTDSDLSLLKEDRELRSQGNSLTDHSVKEKSTVWRPGELADDSQDTSYLEELEKHRFSVCCSSVAAGQGSGEFFQHLHFALVLVFSELQLAQWQSQGFWYIILLMASLWFLRLYLHYLGQWLFLWAISTPVTKFHFYPYTVELCYPSSLLRIEEELPVVVVGPLMLNAIIFLLVLIRWGCQLLFASCPDTLSKLIIAMGLWTVLDPLAVFIVDTFLGRLTPDGEMPIADAAKLYWVFVRSRQPGILGVMITMLLYILLFIISALILYLYGLRLHSDSWILDAFQRIHSEESKFFIPYDLEISNQELSYIVKRSQQWRGTNGERRKVAVYDYIWKSHGIKSSVSSCDLQHQNEISGSALGPEEVTSHVSIYSVYPSGFQELYRHFLRLPGGAIVEVLGDISALKFVHREVIIAIQEHITQMDTVLRESFNTKEEEWKGTINIKRYFFC